MPEEFSFSNGKKLNREDFRQYIKSGQLDSNEKFKKLLSAFETGNLGHADDIEIDNMVNAMSKFAQKNGKASKCSVYFHISESNRRNRYNLKRKAGALDGTVRALEKNIQPVAFLDRFAISCDQTRIVNRSSKRSHCAFNAAQKIVFCTVDGHTAFDSADLDRICRDYHFINRRSGCNQFFRARFFNGSQQKTDLKAFRAVFARKRIHGYILPDDRRKQQDKSDDKKNIQHRQFLFCR